MKSISPAGLKKIIKFYPHDKQKEILRNLNRFTVVVGGKRLGKTIMAAYLAMKQLWIPNSSTWIIAPTHDLTSRIWEYLDLWIDINFKNEETNIFRVNKQSSIIENTRTRAKLWTKTGENQASLLGKGLDLAIIDEASRLKKGLWEGYIEPNLMDREGKAFFISNPYGFNWFYDLYLKGTPEGRAKKGNEQYTSFSIPTAIEDKDGNVIGTNNPTIPNNLEELKRLKLSTTPDVWRQEYLATFQEGVGQRFKNFLECIDDSIKVIDENKWFEKSKPGHLYTIGADLAKVEDFTVITVMDRMTNRMVGFWRVNQIDWGFIKERIKKVSEDYNFAEVTIDASGGIAGSFVDDLRSMGVGVADYIYTNKSKVQLIDKLGMLLESRCVTFPRIPQLLLELRSFSYHFSDSGNLIYGSSKKDDSVNSLALACWDLNEQPLEETTGSGLFIPKRRRYT